MFLYATETCAEDTTHANPIPTNLEPLRVSLSECSSANSVTLEDARVIFGLMERFAQKGCLAAQYKLGLLYLEGRLVTANASKAINLITKAANGGYVDAQVKLGEIYCNTNKLGWHLDQARLWLEKAAAQGNGCALYNLGLICLKRENNPEKAVVLFKQAIAQGELRAWSDLGLSYLNGHGVPADAKKAYDCFMKAGDRNPNALYNLAGLCESGRGIEKSSEKAFKFYQRAAIMGQSKAQCILGWMYAKGHNVPQSYEKAAEWYMKAAQNGDLGAQRSLGDMYREGFFFKKDDKKAAEWYMKAAQNGDSGAQHALGDMHLRGIFFAQDYGRAAYWYQQAAAQGNETARSILLILPLL